MFSVATWNALADCYVRPATFPHCEPATLEWKSRSPLIWREVERLDADIVLLQGLSVERFRVLLALIGYCRNLQRLTTSTSGSKAQRSRATRLSSASALGSNRTDA
jgi:hypothetical protein